jgi:hypothetical protein
VPIALFDDLRVNVCSVLQVDVAKQPVVLVPVLAAQLVPQHHLLALAELLGEGRRLLAEILHGLAGIDCLGVSTPMRRTRSSRPAMSTTRVSPSTTRVTVAISSAARRSATTKSTTAAVTARSIQRRILVPPAMEIRVELLQVVYIRMRRVASIREEMLAYRIV